MPALQVREFPEELYAQLKEAARKQHRSVTQQVIVFIEKGLSAESGSVDTGRTGALHPPVQDYASPLESDGERSARAQRRKDAFEASGAFWPIAIPAELDPASVVASGRDERDAHVLSTLSQAPDMHGACSNGGKIC